MKNNHPLLFLIILITILGCDKWNLEKKNFIALDSGSVVETTATSITIQSEILGFENGKISEHGHIYSCVNPEPDFGLDDVEISTLGIRFEKGKYNNTIEGLSLNTTYYIRAFIFVEGEEDPILGGIIERKIGENIINLSIDTVFIYEGGFEVNGILSGLEAGAEITKYGFVWSNDNEVPTVENDETVYLGIIKENGNFSSSFDNVESLKNYHLRAFAELGKETIFYSETRSFFKGDVWVQKADAPVPILGPFASVVGDDAYIGGGAYNFTFESTQLFKYTPLTDTWDILQSDIGFTSILGGSFSIGNNVYVASGFGDIGNDLMVYNTLDNTWSNPINFPGVNLFLNSATNIQGKGYIGLGINHVLGLIENRMWIYDPVQNNWDVISDFPWDWFNPFIFSNDKEIIYGFDTQGDQINLWGYDLTSQTWTEKPNSTIPGLFPGEMRGVTIGNKGYLIMSIKEDNFWEYDMANNSWTKMSDYPGIIKHDAIFFQVNDKCYYGLGRDFTLGEVVMKDIWEYIPNINPL